MRRTLLALAALILSLSACELRAEIAMSEDGSGTVGMVFAVEPEMLQVFNQSGFGADPFAELRSDLADDPVAWEVDEFSEGRLKGIRAVFAFATIEDLLDKMEALDNDGGSDAAIKDFTIARQSGGWIFEGQSSDPQQELSGGQIPIPVDQLASMLKVQFRVTLPGKAGSHNADEVTSSGGKTTFVWKPSLTSPAVELRATTTPGGASSSVLPVIFGLLALAIIALIWFRRSQGRPRALDPNFSLSPDVVSDVVGMHPNGDEAPGASKEDASLPG